MKMYKILETEMTNDFCESLIGTVAKFLKEETVYIRNGLTCPYFQDYIYLETIDGELMFTPEEVELVNK